MIKYSVGGSEKHRGRTASTAQPWLPLAGVLFLSAAVGYLGFFVDRTNLLSLFGGFVVAFGGYLLLVYRPRAAHFRGCVALGIALRLALVFAFPLLSDDVYRFLWDGYLINAGENPFAHLPAHYLQAGNTLPGLTQELYDRLNSPDYHTIYPPIAQGIFTTAVWLSPGSWYGAAVVMKIFLFACEIGNLYLLHRLLTGPPSADEPNTALAANPDDQRALPLLFYWLNPLIIVEITGNLHFEGAMVFFLLLAFYLLKRSRWGSAAAAMAASVASKLLPLMLLPFLIRRLWGRPFWLFSLVFGFCCLLLFLPFLLAPDFLTGFRSSLELYQQKFEFNASLYYLARAYGYYQVGWNQIATIGPALAKIAAGGILFLALADRRRDWDSLPEGWLWAFLIYLLCATTVHPWYLSVPIVLCCLTRWRFPLVWSFLITLTYTSYATEPYRENLWLVAIEYVVVAGFAVWEAVRFRRQKLARYPG